MREAYSILARFYDLCMEVDYGEWVDYLLELCRFHHHTPHSVIDLGCGTGNLTIPLAQQGWRLTGVDLSWAMIAEARGKAAGLGLEIPFYVADLRDCRLPGAAFDTAISGCDVLNYLTSESDLERAFETVFRLLTPGGLWLFDLNSLSKVEEVYGNNCYADFQDDFAYFWDNSYDAEKGICTMDLTFLCGPRRDCTNGFASGISSEYGCLSRLSSCVRTTVLNFWAAMISSPPVQRVLKVSAGSLWSEGRYEAGDKNGRSTAWVLLLVYGLLNVVGFWREVGNCPLSSSCSARAIMRLTIWPPTAPHSREVMLPQ